MSGVFTGIIQHVGLVTAAAPSAAGRRLRLDLGPLAGRIAPGASLAVDGACLTAAAVAGAQADFDVVPETLARTTLGELAPGDRVNLEPALPAGAALDGHIVQGHVDGVAEAADIARGQAGWRVAFSAPEALSARMVVKGSVALAGVSLTLAEVAAGRFAVALIPTTLEATTLGALRPGRRCNLELDVIGKYVWRYLEGLTGRAGGVTLEALRQAGFA